MMKAISVIGHPILLISIYLLLIIEGEQFGGLYILYILLALPHGGNYALLALAGIAFILAGNNIHWKKFHLFKPFLYLTGFVLMILSLIFFFAKGGKEATFGLTIPLLSYVLFGICSLCFLIRTLNLIIKTKDSSLHPST